MYDPMSDFFFFPSSFPPDDVYLTGMAFFGFANPTARYLGRTPLGREWKSLPILRNPPRRMRGRHNL